jgi:hypothetical protein
LSTPVYAVAVDPTPHVLIIGKAGGKDWTIGLEGDDEGAIQSLADVLAAEVRVSLPDGDKVWSIDDGGVAIVDDAIEWRFTEEDSAAMPPGVWSQLVSIGLVAGVADDPVLVGSIKAQEP